MTQLGSLENVLETHPSSCTTGTGSLGGGVKRAKRDPDHQPLLAPRLKTGSAISISLSVSEIFYDNILQLSKPQNGLEKSVTGTRFEPGSPRIRTTPAKNEVYSTPLNTCNNDVSPS